MESAKIDLAKIQHIAKLARLGISDDEAIKYVAQMNAVLGYMDILNEAQTDDVDMTLQVTGLKNVTRDDVVKAEVNPGALLETSTLPKINGQIAVRAVIKEE
jgi:aspartyl-tRNA(Asn)/glutamyl-tRNA(Gln) amidotransferase subunit C